MSETAENPALQGLVKVAEVAKSLTKAETSVVALAEEAGQMVHYITGAGKHIARLQGRRAPSATSGLCGVTFQAGEAQLICSTAGDTRVRQDQVKALGIETALAVPVYHEGQLLGALMVLNREDGSLFDVQAEQALTEYAAQAAPEIADYLKNNPPTEAE